MNILGDPSRRLVVAHRGYSARFPENTLESFDAAVAAGPDALEFDIRLSADGVAVVMHDPTVDRTTNGSGAVGSLTLDQLRSLDAGARFKAGDQTPFRGAGLRVPTLEEMLLRYRSIPLVIEMKEAGAAVEARRVIERCDAQGRVLIDSTKLDAVTPFRPDILTGASTDGVARLLPRALLGLAPKNPPYGAVCIPMWYYGIPIPVVALARSARAKGIPTHVWTIDDSAVATRLWRSGINGIITNDTPSMLLCRQHYDL